MLEYRPACMGQLPHVLNTKQFVGVVITFLPENLAYKAQAVLWSGADLTLKEMLGYLEAHRG